MGATVAVETSGPTSRICRSRDTKSLEELEELAANLRQQIALHPEDSRLDSAELKDVEEWIAPATGEGCVVIRREAAPPARCTQ